MTASCDSKSVVSTATASTVSTTSSMAPPSPPQQTKKQQRKVTFYKKVKVRPTIHLMHYSDEEYNATWLQPHEYTQIRLDIRATVEQMEKGTASDDDDDSDALQQDACSTTRGLEFRTRQGYAKRVRNKQEAIATVLDEQELQRHQGVADASLIADLYIHCTAPSRNESQKLGMKDQRSAYGEYHNSQDLSRLQDKLAKISAADLCSPRRRQRQTAASKLSSVSSKSPPTKRMQLLCAAA